MIVRVLFTKCVLDNCFGSGVIVVHSDVVVYYEFKQYFLFFSLACCVW